MTGGVKYDEGKPMVDLLVPEFLEGMARIMTFGARKYEVDNWRGVPDHERRYVAALYRHLLAYHRGERTDPESGENHMLHAACNAMFLYWFDLQEGKGREARPKDASQERLEKWVN